MEYLQICEVSENNVMPKGHYILLSSPPHPHPQGRKRSSVTQGKRPREKLD